MERREADETESFSLMTTNSAGFYEQLGFRRVGTQQLLVRQAGRP